MALDFRLSRSSYKIGPQATRQPAPPGAYSVGITRLDSAAAHERYTPCRSPATSSFASLSSIEGLSPAASESCSQSSLGERASHEMKKSGEQVLSLVDVCEDSLGKTFVPGLLVLDRPRGMMCFYRVLADSLHSARRELMGSFNLDMVSYVEKDCRPKVGLCFVVHYRGKKHYFKTASWQVMEEWVDILRECSKVNKEPVSPVTSPVAGHQPATPQYSAGSFHRTNSLDGVLTGIHEDSATESSEDNSSQNSLPLVKPDHVIKASYCVKQGKIVRNWKRRYLVLDSGHISYYKNEQSKASLKKVPVQAIIDARVSREEGSRDNLMVLETDDRDFYIQFDTPEQMRSWVEEIRKVVNLPHRTYL